MGSAHKVGTLVLVLFGGLIILRNTYFLPLYWNGVCTFGFEEGRSATEIVAIQRMLASVAHARGGNLQRHVASLHFTDGRTASRAECIHCATSVNGFLSELEPGNAAGLPNKGERTTG